jgi:hypothetical protein
VGILEDVDLVIVVDKRALANCTVKNNRTEPQKEGNGQRPLDTVWWRAVY